MPIDGRTFGSLEAKEPQGPASPDESGGIDSTLEDWLDRYSRDQCAVTVDFRETVSWLTGREQTHHLHPYPAKLLPHIAHFFSRSTLLSRPGDLILDPFCGSGTVGLEAILANRNACLVDANPLARLIAAVKTRPIDQSRVLDATKRIWSRVNRGVGTSRQVVNRDHWYYPHVIRDLNKLAGSIDREEDDEIRRFMLVALSNCARRVSLADPRVSVAVRLNPDRYAKHTPSYEKTVSRIAWLKRVSVLEEFQTIVDANAGRTHALASDLKARRCIARAQVTGEDAKKLPLEDGSVRLVVTSPPYGGAQKYIRASYLGLCWTGLATPPQLRSLEELSIGREHFDKTTTTHLKKTGVTRADGILKKIFEINPLRATILCTYLLEMKDAMSEVARVVKSGGRVVLIAGDNMVCGVHFPTALCLGDLLRSSGFVLELELHDNIRSRGLMTKRNETAGLISHESISLYRKCDGSR